MESQTATHHKEPRPLWIGFAMTGLGIILQIAAAGASRAGMATTGNLLVDLCGLAYLSVVVYYLMIQYRLTQILEGQAAWWGSYSAAGLVGRQFIPLYNLYVLYNWYTEVAAYDDWRVGRRSDSGLWAFLVIFACAVVGGDSDTLMFLLPAGLIASFQFLYPTFLLALTFDEPAERPKINSIFGLA